MYTLRVLDGGRTGDSRVKHLSTSEDRVLSFNQETQYFRSEYQFVVEMTSTVRPIELCERWYRKT